MKKILYTTLILILLSISSITNAFSLGEIIERYDELIGTKLERYSDIYINKGKLDLGIESFEKVIVKAKKRADTYRKAQKWQYYRLYVMIIESLEEGVDKMQVAKSSLELEKEGIKVGKTEEEKEEIRSEVQEEIEAKGVNGNNESKLADTLSANGYTDLETRLTLMRTFSEDTFKFCANFTPDIYKSNLFRKYDGSDEAKRLYGDELVKFQLDYKTYTSAGRNTNTGRAVQCGVMMYRISQSFNTLVTQDTVKELYEKHFKEPYKKHTVEFYKLKDFDFENMDEHLEKHHNG